MSDLTAILVMTLNTDFSISIVADFERGVASTDKCTQPHAWLARWGTYGEEQSVALSEEEWFKARYQP